MKHEMLTNNEDYESAHTAGENDDFSENAGKKILSLYDKRDARRQEAVRQQYADSLEIRKAINHFLDELLAAEDDDGFAGFSARLFMLVDFQKGDKTETELVPIGYGVYSKQAFEKDADHKKIANSVEGTDTYNRKKAKLEAIWNTTFDIYCVPEYLAETFKDDANEFYHNPTEYLRKHALFVANNGQVVMTDRKYLKALERDDFDFYPELDYDIKPIAEDEALKQIAQMQDSYHQIVDQAEKEN